MKIRVFLKTLFIWLRDKLILRKKAVILMYHSISDAKEFHVVSNSEFEWQMQYLANNNYKVVSLSELIENPNQNGVAITFDDGYEDNYLNAFPILSRFGFPATIFLTTGNIANKKYKNPREIDFPMLDWQQIGILHQSGLIDIEPHTVTHPKLSSTDRVNAFYEIIQSKELIEKALNKKCSFFAYPFGDFSDISLDIVRNHFDGAVTVSPGYVCINDNVFQLKRNSIDSMTGRCIFRFKI